MDQGNGQKVEWLDRLVDAVCAIHELALEIGGGAQGEHTASLSVRVLAPSRAR